MVLKLNHFIIIILFIVNKVVLINLLTGYFWLVEERLGTFSHLVVNIIRLVMIRVINLLLSFKLHLLTILHLYLLLRLYLILVNILHLLTILIILYLYLIEYLVLIWIIVFAAVRSNRVLIKNLFEILWILALAHIHLTIRM